MAKKSAKPAFLVKKMASSKKAKAPTKAAGMSGRTTTGKFTKRK